MKTSLWIAISASSSLLAAGACGIDNGDPGGQSKDTRHDEPEATGVVQAPLYATLAAGFAQCDVAALPPGTPLADTGILGIAGLSNGTVRTGMNGGGLWSFTLPAGCPASPIVMTDVDPGAVLPGSPAGSNTSFPNGPVLDLVLGLTGKLHATRAYNHVAEINPADGATVTTIPSPSGFALGLTVDPRTGDLYFTSFTDVFRVELAASGTCASPPCVTPFGSSSAVGSLDGIAWSCDGKTLVAAASGNNIAAWTRAGGAATLFSSSVRTGVPGGVGPDGIAFGLPGTALSNFVYTNDNDGSVSEICINAGVPTAAICPTAKAPSTRSPIASGSGKRGDFMTVDTRGNLLVSQLDRVTVVTPPGGGRFVEPGSNACANFQCALASADPACSAGGGPLTNACDPVSVDRFCGALANTNDCRTDACAAVRQAAQVLQDAQAASVIAWAPNTNYAVGAVVSFGGEVYQAIQAHRSLAAWSPPVVPLLWLHPTPCGIAPWKERTRYLVGSRVTFQGVTYRCIQQNDAVVGPSNDGGNRNLDWDPVHAPALWAVCG